MKKLILLLSLLISLSSISQVKVVGGIVTNGTADYGTHHDTLGIGGFMTVANITGRNSIPSLRRKVGMLVYVASADSLYQLKGGITNSNWSTAIHLPVASITAANGLSLTGSTVRLGGTLSGNTIIDGDESDFVLDNMINTNSTSKGSFSINAFDVSSDYHSHIKGYTTDAAKLFEIYGQNDVTDFSPFIDGLKDSLKVAGNSQDHQNEISFRASDIISANNYIRLNSSLGNYYINNLPSTTDTTSKPLMIGSDGKLKKARSWAEVAGGSADGNNYLSGTSWNGTSYVLGLTRNGLGTVTQDLTHIHPASHITSGSFAAARLATGTPVTGYAPVYQADGSVAWAAVSGGGNADINKYISNSGNNTNSGLTASLAKQTIAGTTINASDVINLAANSQFHEQLTPASGSIIQSSGLDGLGEKKRAIINAGDDTNSGWTLTSGQTNVYELTFSHTMRGMTGYDNPQIVEIDKDLDNFLPLTARKYFKHVNSVAEVASNSGSYYHSGFGSPLTIYIHPSNNLTPNSNAKYRYEITKRDAAIYGYDADNVKYKNLYLYSGGHGYGTLHGGKNTVIDGCYLEGGSTHTTVIKSGAISNFVYSTGGHETPSTEIAHVFYEADGSGNKSSMRNGMFFDYYQAALFHTSGVPHDEVYLENLYAWGVTTSDYTNTLYGSNDVTSCKMDGVYGDKSQKFVEGNVTLVNSMFRDIWGSSDTRGTIKNTFINGNNNPVRQIGGVDNIPKFLQPAYGTLNVSNSIIYGQTAHAFTMVLANAATVDLSYNIFIMDGTNLQNSLFYEATRTGGYGGGFANFSSKNNVFIILAGTTAPDHLFKTNGTGYPYGDDLETMQASGLESNSLVFNLSNTTTYPLGLKTIFVDPANGDWRLNNGTQANQIRSIGAGMITSPKKYPVRPQSLEEAVKLVTSGQLKRPLEQ